MVAPIEHELRTYVHDLPRESFQGVLAWKRDMGGDGMEMDISMPSPPLTSLISVCLDGFCMF